MNLSICISLLLYPLALWGQIPLPADVRQEIAQLTPAERAELLESKQRFDRLSPSEQKRIRVLHEQLNRDPRKEELQRVMNSYAQWLKALPSGQRQELLEMSAATRLQEIKRLMQEQERARFNEFTSRGLRPSDRDAIIRWFGVWLRDNEEELIKILPPELQRRAAASSDAELRRWLLYAFRRRASQSRPPVPGFEFTDQDVARLTPDLSVTARQMLEEMGSRGQRDRLLNRWVAAAMLSRSFSRSNNADVQAFFQRLDAETRERLENLPRDRMRSELQRLYLQQRLR